MNSDATAQHLQALLDAYPDQPILLLWDRARWHQGRLWLIEAGSGYLGTVDEAAGTFERLCFCPGFLRGIPQICQVHRE
jgi:hypothetical protein